MMARGERLDNTTSGRHNTHIKPSRKGDRQTASEFHSSCIVSFKNSKENKRIKAFGSNGHRRALGGSESVGRRIEV
jgi:hypothetical protein